MRFKIIHEIKGRMRVHLEQKSMTFKEADILEYYLLRCPNITAVKIYERNQNVAVFFYGDRETVNQASLTGEALPVAKNAGGYVYAGTVLEEGELTVQVKETAGGTKFEKIVTMIEESEKLKSSMEGKAEHLADQGAADCGKDYFFQWRKRR